jgi:hypothetical protein
MLYSGDYDCQYAIWWRDLLDANQAMLSSISTSVQTIGFSWLDFEKCSNQQHFSSSPDIRSEEVFLLKLAWTHFWIA